MGYGGTGPELLANETLMRQGQVIRSTTNQVYIHYRSLRQTNHGMFSLHYQGKLTLQIDMLWFYKQGTNRRMGVCDDHHWFLTFIYLFMC